MSYEMKKALRKTTGNKSYAQQEEGDVIIQNEPQRQLQPAKESIFQHKNWGSKEKIRLMVFLRHYHSLPDWLSQRRSIHLYKHLSNFLRKSRTPEQCKNIHSLFKRKFSSLAEVVQAMRSELIEEQNFEKHQTKYEKQIEKFEAEYNLFAGLSEEHHRPLEPIRSKIVDPEHQEQQERREQSENYKFNLNEYIKRQECVNQRSGRQNLIWECQFYWKEWLKCATVLQIRAKKSESQQS